MIGKVHSVLILDDELYVRQMIQTALDKRGYMVINFANGYDALKYCENNTPDLVILDIGMPGMDGITFYQMLQEIPKGNTVPVLFLSGQVEEFHNAKEMMPNAIDLVSKPIKIKELIKYVDDYFKKQSVSRHPIFTGDLGTIDIWQLLKNIESNGVNGTIEIQRKDGKNVEFTLNKGMLDEVHLLNEDGDDPISYLIAVSYTHL